MGVAQRQSEGSGSVLTRLHEADMCRARGLLMPAFELYQRVLQDFPALSNQMVTAVRRKMDEVTREIAEHEELGASPTAEESGGGDSSTGLPDILSKANALCDLGLFDEAAAEYETIFRSVPPDDAAIVAYARTLLSAYRPAAVQARVLQLITSLSISSQEKSNLLTVLAREFESRNHGRQAEFLFDGARSLVGGAPSLERPTAPANSTSSSASRSRYDYLLRSNLLTQDQLREATKRSQKSGRSVDLVLVEDFSIDKATVGKSLSMFYNVPFRRFEPDLPIPYELIRNLKKKFLLSDHWVPIKFGKMGIEIMVDDPGDIHKTDHIRALVNARTLVLNVAFREDIHQHIEAFFRQQEVAEPQREEHIDLDSLVPQIEFEAVDEPIDEGQSIDESASQIVRLVDQLLVTAFRDGVSDVHVEPQPQSNRTTIRFRRDGVCQEYMQLPNAMVRPIVSRLKVMAGLDIAERRLPQDGKIKFKRKGIPPFELRLATIPTVGGFEDAVLRVLAKAGALKLDDMGLAERNLTLLKELVTHPHGIILVVGPTGSGKTTTLHSLLGFINQPGIKIWTVEDPVEISQPGLRQVEVNNKTGLDFSRVMRSFLRADPDVIMIGEMRDLETASTAVEASLTGHLVFSTLHTNSAPETVTRLLDMGLNALNFSDAMLGVLAQRLVRRLCSSCKKPYTPSREEFNEIEEQYGEAAFETTGIIFSSSLTLQRGTGCDACAGSGYRGRLGIHELLEGTPAVRRLIKRSASSDELFSQGSMDGMTTLKQDAILKVFRGLTDMNEVRRVCA